jgi:HlyD family secretion protein
MTAELALSAEQKTRAEAILTTMRSKMALAHQATEAERKKQLAAARSEMHQQMTEMLNDEQRAKFVALGSDYAERRSNSTTGRIYVLGENGPVETQVRLGLSDGAMTEVMSAAPPEGAEVIIGTAVAGQGSSGGATPARRSGPRMF